MTFTQLTPGTLFAEDFHVIQPLGEGGMGAVYVVHQRSTNAHRALKLMRPELLQDAKLRERFHLEATISTAIGSEHVVKVITAGIDHATGLPYLVMELLEGEGLEAMVNRRGAIPWNETYLLLAQLCHGLAAAHANAVVHRDLKPENIYVARSHRADVPFTVKILDFGIAKVVAEAMATSRAATQSLGTPLFMAPEQANPRSVVSPSTDVWSLALITFYMMTGRMYWLSANVESASIHSLLAEILQSPMAPPSVRLAELGGAECLLPTGFDAWFGACTQRDPAARYGAADAAFQALSPLLRGAAMRGTFAAAPGAGTLDTQHYVQTVGWNQAQGQTVAAAVGPSGTQLADVKSGPIDRQAATQWQSPGGAVGTRPWNPGPTVSSSVVGAAHVQAATGPMVTTGAGGLSRTTPPPSKRSRVALLVGLMAALVGIVTVAAGATGYSLWAKERVEYCAEIIEPWSEPQCSRAVPESDVAQRARSYRITRSKGHVREVVFVNNAGQPVEDDRGYCRWTYTYEGGRVKEQTLHAKDGRVLAIFRFSSDHTRVEILGPAGTPYPAPETECVVGELELDEHGLVTKDRCFSIKGSPTADRDGAFGSMSRYDDRSRLLEVTTLGPDGNPAFDKYHRQVIRREYGAVGDVVKESFTTVDGKPHPDDNGCCGYAYERDKVGNDTKSTCLGPDGQPTLDRRGIAEVRSQYDARGNLIDVRHFDLSGKPTYDNNGVAGVKERFDDRGHPIERRFFGVDGRPTNSAKGVAGYDQKYDGDHVIAITYVGIDGKPTHNRDSVAGKRHKYDERGNVVETSYVDVQGKPMLCEDGYATERMKRDANDEVSERAYFDAGGLPVVTEEGYATVRYELDDMGHVVKESYFGVDGSPTLASSWAAAVTRSFDDRGNELETTYLGLDGQPTFHREGYAIVRRAFNDRGTAVQESYFDPAGKPAWSIEGMGMKRVKVDDHGRVIEESYHDPEGRLIPNENGVAVERKQYDAAGRVVMLSKLDAFNRPVRDKESGYAARMSAYDQRGNALQHTYLDEKAKPITGKDKVAIVRYEYDERGELTAESYFDAAANPIAGPSGAHVERTKRDARGYATEWAFFDAAGDPVKTREGYILVRTGYDELGRQNEWRYFDAEGKPVKLPSGYASSFKESDARGRCTRTWTTDETGRPAMVDGYHEARYEYDARGNRTLEVTLDGDGQPAKRRGGYAQVWSTYDERSNLIERGYLDASGQPAKQMLTSRYTHDARGDVIETRLFDWKGKPGPNSEGVSIERVKRDDRGRAIERSYFDKDDKPGFYRPLGGSSVRIKYDETGTVREEQVLDTRGRVTKTLRYDAEGNLVK